MLCTVIFTWFLILIYGFEFESSLKAKVKTKGPSPWHPAYGINYVIFEFILLTTCSKFLKIMLCTIIFTWFLILINGFGWSPQRGWRWRQGVPLLGILHMYKLCYLWFIFWTKCSKLLKINLVFTDWLIPGCIGWLQDPSS